MNKGAFEAFRDASLIAALAALGLLCFHTAGQPVASATPVPPRLGPIRGVVVHDSACPNAEDDYHFVIGNGVHYRDGEIVTTAAWRAQKVCPGLRDADRARSTVSVAMVLAGSESPTAAQQLALQRLVDFLRDSCGADDPELVYHDAVDADGCAVVHR